MSLHGKLKEIYKYEAPWTVHAMNWTVRPDKRFRLALGSFVEEYNNKVTSRKASCPMTLAVILMLFLHSIMRLTGLRSFTFVCRFSRHLSPKSSCLYHICYNSPA